MSLAVGRIFVAASGGALYRRFDEAGGAASLLLGAGTITLASILLSSLGFPTLDLPLLVAALLLPLLAACARRRRLDALRPRGSAAGWASLLVPVGLAAALGLLPVARHSAFAFGNDSYTYGAFAEWLQHHAFSETARWEPQSPVTGIPALWQSQHYDLGIAHLLALVQAAARPASVLLVYPQVSTFALVLLTAALWLAARQLLRLGKAASGATALLFAAVPHALYWGHHNGFLQQGYALAFVVLGLVLLAHSAPPARWRLSTAALAAVPFAFVVSVYLPLLPVLGGASAWALYTAWARAGRRARRRQLVGFVACTAACVALYAGRDLLGALSPLHRFATSVTGGHVPWSAVELAQFALGTRTPSPGWDSVELAPWSGASRALTPLYGVLVLAGLWHAARRPRTRPLLAAALVIAVTTAYFALAVTDPWRGGRGHSWNLFKLAQWGWPFVLLLGAAGARALARNRKLSGVVTGLALAVLASQVAVHWPWSARLALTMTDILAGATLDDVPALRQRIRDLPPGTLLLVGRPANVNRWLATAVSLIAYPRAIVGDWTDSASSTNHPGGGEALYVRLLEGWNGPHVVPIAAGFVPFQPGGGEELGGGFARLAATSKPRLLHVVNPAGLVRGAGGPSFSVGEGRTKLVVFSPAGGDVVLGLTLRPYAGRPGTRLVAHVAGGDYSHRSVRLAADGSPQAVLALSGETVLRLPLRLPRGLATVVLVVDEGRGELDARDQVTVTGVSLEAGSLAGLAPGG